MMTPRRAEPIAAASRRGRESVIGDGDGPVERLQQRLQGGPVRVLSIIAKPARGLDLPQICGQVFVHARGGFTPAKLNGFPPTGQALSSTEESSGSDRCGLWLWCAGALDGGAAGWLGYGQNMASNKPPHPERLSIGPLLVLDWYSIVSPVISLASGREPPDILTRFAPLNPMRWSKMTILRNMLWYRALRMSSFGGSWAGFGRCLGSCRG